MNRQGITVPLEVVVVDTDLLWRVEAMNAIRGVMIKDVVTVLEAIDHLTPDLPAVVLLGPGAAAGQVDQLPELRQAVPEVTVLAMTDDASAGAAADLTLPADAPIDQMVEQVLAEVERQRELVDSEVTDAAAAPLSDTRIVVVTAAKGGDGATTVAANLAVRLARGGRTVGLVETDPVFGDLGMVFGLPAARTGIVPHDATGVRLVEPPRPLDPFAPIDVDALLDTISQAQPAFDTLILDAPPSVVARGDLERLADQVLVVCSARLTSVKNTMLLLDLLGHGEHLGVVVNRVGRRGIDPDEIEQVIRAHVVAELPLDEDLDTESLERLPGLAHDGSPFVTAIDALAQALIAPAAGAAGLNRSGGRSG